MNRFRKAIRHCKKNINESPTNSMGGIYSLNAPGFRVGGKDRERKYYPDIDGNFTSGIPGTEGDPYYLRPEGYWNGGSDWDEDLVPDASQEFLINDPTGKDTSDLIAEDGTVKTFLPPDSRSFILGPLVDGYVLNHGNDDFTNIGYIQKDTRQFVLLARTQGQITANLHSENGRTWDGTADQLTIYNASFTLAMAEWFRDQITSGKSTNNVPYFYSGGVPQQELNIIQCPNCAPHMFGGVTPGVGGGFGTGTPPSLGSLQEPPQSGDQVKINYFNLSPDQVKTLAILLGLGLSIAAVIAVLFPEPSSSAAGAVYLSSKFRFAAALKRSLFKLFKQPKRVPTPTKVKYKTDPTDPMDRVLRQIDKAGDALQNQPRTDPTGPVKKRFPMGDSYEYTTNVKDKLIFETFQKTFLNETAATGSGLGGGMEVADAYVNKVSETSSPEELEQASNDANDIAKEGDKGLSDAELAKIDQDAEAEAKRLTKVPITDPESMDDDQLFSTLDSIYNINSVWVNDTMDRLAPLIPQSELDKLNEEYEEKEIARETSRETIQGEIDEIDKNYNTWGGGAWTDPDGIRYEGNVNWGAQFTKQSFESSGQSFEEYNALRAQLGFFNDESGPDEYGRYYPGGWEAWEAREKGYRPEQFTGVLYEIVSRSYKMDEIKSNKNFPQPGQNIYYTEADYNEAVYLQDEYGKIFAEYVNLFEGPGGFDDLREKLWDFENRSHELMKQDARDARKRRDGLESQLDNLRGSVYDDEYDNRINKIFRPYLITFIKEWNEFNSGMNDFETADAYDNYNWLWKTYGIDAAEWYLNNQGLPMESNPFIPVGMYVPFAKAKEDPYSLAGLTPSETANMSPAEKKKLMQQLVNAGLVNSDGTLKAEALSDDITSDLQRALEKLFQDAGPMAPMPIEQQPPGGNMPTPPAEELLDPDRAEDYIAANPKMPDYVKDSIRRQYKGGPDYTIEDQKNIINWQKKMKASNAKTDVAHYEPPKFIKNRERKSLTETRTPKQKRILREIKQPIKVKEAPTKYKMNFSGKFSAQNTPDKTASAQSDALVASGNAKGQKWRQQDKYWAGYETTERMNIIHDRVGHGKQAWDMILDEAKKKNGWRTKEIQEELNKIAHERAMLKENPDYASPFGNVEVSTTEKNLQNFEKVNKIKKVVSDKKIFSNKEIKPEYPEEDKESKQRRLSGKMPERLEMDDGMDKQNRYGNMSSEKGKIQKGYEHEKLNSGERASAYYKKLDPISADSMPDAAYPQINDFRNKARKKPK